jgi:multicomponent Na+:H+ antiporter subunit E
MHKPVSINSTASSRWCSALLVFASCLLLWILLTSSLDAQELLAGVLVALAVSLLFNRRFHLFTGLRITPLLPFHLFVYLGHFLLALLRANIDLALRVLSPSLPIRPQLVAVRTGLQSPLGRLLLANTITLTPGTLTVDVTGDTLLVHWVYCPPGTDAVQATHAIAAAFEHNLGKFLR